MVVGPPFYGGLFFEERDQPLPTGRLLLGDFRRQHRSCPCRVEMPQALARRADRGVNVRPFVRWLDLLTRLLEYALYRFSSA